MSITVELSPETEAALRPIAAGKGLDLTELLAEFAAREARRSPGFPMPENVAHYPTATTVEERLAALDQLIEFGKQWGLSPSPPEADERAFYYEDERHG